MALWVTCSFFSTRVWMGPWTVDLRAAMCAVWPVSTSALRVDPGRRRRRRFQRAKQTLLVNGTNDECCVSRAVARWPGGDWRGRETHVSRSLCPPPRLSSHLSARHGRAAPPPIIPRSAGGSRCRAALLALFCLVRGLSCSAERTPPSWSRTGRTSLNRAQALAAPPETPTWFAPTSPGLGGRAGST